MAAIRDYLRAIAPHPVFSLLWLVVWFESLAFTFVAFAAGALGSGAAALQVWQGPLACLITPWLNVAALLYVGWRTERVIKNSGPLNALIAGALAAIANTAVAMPALLLLHFSGNGVGILEMLTMVMGASFMLVGAVLLAPIGFAAARFTRRGL